MDGEKKDKFRRSWTKCLKKSVLPISSVLYMISITVLCIKKNNTEIKLQKNNIHCAHLFLFLHKIEPVADATDNVWFCARQIPLHSLLP